MTIRIYIDEDAMDGELVRALRARGVDLHAANEVGMVEREDGEQLAYSTAQGRAIYSLNIADFCRLHTEWVEAQRVHGGIILSRQQHYSVGEQMRRLLKLIATRTAVEMQNRLEFLSDWS